MVISKLSQQDNMNGRSPSDTQINSETNITSNFSCVYYKICSEIIHCYFSFIVSNDLAVPPPENNTDINLEPRSLSIGIMFIRIVTTKLKYCVKYF